MRYLKKYEGFDGLKKYIELNLLNLIVICELISKPKYQGVDYIQVLKLYTYDTITKTLSKNNEEPTNLIYDNFMKETIGKQSDDLNELLEPLELESSTNKYNI
jgi:hypothetical protein